MMEDISAGSIVKSIIDPLIVLDIDEKIKMVNHALEMLLGYKEDELVGLPFSSIRAKVVTPWEIQIKSLMEGAVIRDYDIVCKTKTGEEVPVSFSGAAIRNDNGEMMGVIGTMHDIKQKERLMQKEKLEVMGTMAGNIAHEVRNPLGIIMQGINHLEQIVQPDNKEFRETLSLVKDAAKRADRIVTLLLDFPKTTSLELRLEDINSILEDSVNLIKNKLGDINVIRKIQKDLPKVMVDKNKLEQVLINIFLNAIHAMSNTGKITLRTYDKTLEKVKSGVGRRKEDYFSLGERAVIVEIEDTGAGIGEENMKKIFNLFFTTKGSGEKGGMGLFICRDIITKHRGLFEIESRLGKGTKAVITLKIARG